MQVDAGRERRRRDLVGQVARATYPVRQSVGEFIEGFPCNVIGHYWVEIPRPLRRSKANEAHRMRFRCSRCFLMGGSN